MDGDPREPQLGQFDISSQVAEEAARRDEARAEAVIGEITFLLPLGMVMFLGAWCILAPYLVSRIGAAHPSSGLERMLLFGGRWRWALIVLGMITTIGVLIGIRVEAVKTRLRRSGLAGQAIVKLALFIPVVAAVAVVLLSVFVPLMGALGGV